MWTNTAANTAAINATTAATIRFNRTFGDDRCRGISAGCITLTWTGESATEGAPSRPATACDIWSAMRLAAVAAFAAVGADTDTSMTNVSGGMVTSISFARSGTLTPRPTESMTG